jgi:hypothetical protein
MKEETAEKAKAREMERERERGDEECSSIRLYVILSETVKEAE